MIEAVISEVLRKKLKIDLADQIHAEIVEALYKRHGGETVYILKKPKIDKGELLALFNGRNMDTVCDRYGITRQRVYQILNEGL
jgi:Mor family transcriptional regulator